MEEWIAARLAAARNDAGNDWASRFLSSDRPIGLTLGPHALPHPRCVIARASEAWREAIQKKTPRFDGEGEAWIATPSATARNDGVFNLSLGLPRGLQLLAMTREMIGPHALYEVTGQQALRFL